jgi:YjbE family integral membrane protein
VVPTPVITTDELTAFAQVVLVDLTLAGDNAIVLGTIAGKLTGRERRLAMTVGVMAAAALRILLALVATKLLAVIGLTLAGGLLLLWVAWKMARELTGKRHGHPDAADKPPVSMRLAMLQIVIADLSMSLDNVLAVAGTARQHVWVLVTGLVLSVALMGTASLVVARLMERAPWLAWVGIAIVCYAAVTMIIDGWGDVAGHFA